MFKEGDKVPAALLRASFEMVNAPSAASSDVASPVTLAELASGGKTVVLYFYPKDSTPGCTREAQGFTASKKAIEKAGGVVVGVSRDSVKSHCSFRDRYGLSIPLLSDPDRKLHEGFGAWGEKVMYGKKVLGAIRSTFLIKDGVVAKVWPSVKVDGHVEAVIEALGASPARPSPGAGEGGKTTRRSATAKKSRATAKKQARAR